MRLVQILASITAKENDDDYITEPSGSKRNDPVRLQDPLPLVRYAVIHRLAKHPSFTWIQKYLQSRGEIDHDKVEVDRMVFAARSRAKKYMFGVEVPNSVRHALQLDEQNGNHLWRDAINKELKELRDFETFKIPDDPNFDWSKYKVIQVDPNIPFSVELVAGDSLSRKVSGTTDVVIAKSEDIRNDCVRNNIETLIELTKPNNMVSKDHCPQTIIEHVTASYLNPEHAVVSVLTDLGQNWIFFWFAPSEDDEVMCLYKLTLDGDEAPSEAKYILDSLFNNVVGESQTLPSAFAKRQCFLAVANSVNRKKARLDFSSKYHDRNDKNHKPSSGGAGHNPDPTFYSSSRSAEDKSNTTSNAGVDGNTPLNLAHALSLFAPAADRDIANQLDLVDMLEPEEQHEIVSSFVAKHILPYMKG